MLRRIRLEVAKWTQTMQISWSQQMAYKLNFLLLIVGPTLVFFFVKYNLWSSIYSLPDVGRIGGYDLPGMLTYQAWVMVVAFLAQGYSSMSLAEDIRLGRISSYLIYPFELWQFHAAGFVAFQAIQLGVAAVTVAATVAGGLVTLPSAATLATGTLYSLLVSVFWFVITYSFGLAAFWLEETWVLRVMFLTLSNFLSGAILPLEIYPGWLRRLLDLTPFPYITYVPSRVFMASYDGSVARAAATVVGWTLAAACLTTLVWRRGMRLYTAAGM